MPPSSSAALATTQRFIWPIDNHVISQTYGCKGCLDRSKQSERYNAGVDVHSGYDLRPKGASCANYSTPVKAVAGGVVVKRVQFGDASHGLGNTVIIQHRNDLYSLYAHLDSITVSLGGVDQGQQIGIMGNSSKKARDDSFCTHLHFEVKSLGVLANRTDDGDYWGYTPGNPEDYGFHAPGKYLGNVVPLMPSDPVGQFAQPSIPSGSQARPLKDLKEKVEELVPTLKSFPPPVVTQLEPSSGAPGITIKIYGRYLNPRGAALQPRVMFEAPGRPRASGELVPPLTDNELTVIVPAGSGSIDVHIDTVGGSSSKVRFTYLPPRIKEIRPQQGGTKQAITLVGENFGIKRPLGRFYVKIGKSVVAGSGIVSWDDRQIVVNTPSDFGSGTNDDMLLGAIGCLARAGTGGLTAVQDFVFDLAIPGCISLFESLVKKHQLKVNPNGAGGPVQVTVTTTVDTSNELTYTYRIGAIKGSGLQAQTGTVAQTARPEISSSLRLFDSSGKTISAGQSLAGGQTISAEFTITNSGSGPVVLDVLTVGGRLGQAVIDFPFQQGITLNAKSYAKSSYTYRGKLTLTTPGNYHFFTAYRTKDGQWNTAIPTLAGVTNTLDFVATAPARPQPTVQLNPNVIVSPYSGSRGTLFSQPGQGFSPNSSVTLYFRKPDGGLYPPLKKTTDAQGRFSNSWNAPPDALVGMYQYWAVDDRTGRQSPVISYAVTVPSTSPAPAVPPTPPPAPDPQFLAQVQQVRSAWQQLNAQASQLRYPTDADRLALSQDLQRGSQALQAAEGAAQRGDRATAGAQLQQAQLALGAVSQRLAQLAPPPTLVNPQVTVSPSTGPRGTAFSQPGQGFTPNSTATIHYRKPDGTEYPPVRQPTDGQGRFQRQWTPGPEAQTGTYQTWAADDRTGRQSPVISYAVTAPPVFPGPGGSSPVAVAPRPPVAAPSPSPTPPMASVAFTVSNTSGIGLRLRGSPSVNTPVIANLPEGTRMTVNGGPVQAEGYTWWRLTGPAGTGWAAVGNWLTPAPSPGGTVTVANTGGIGLRLRASPSMNGAVIASLPEGTRMTVSGGPVQADGYTWWKLSGPPGTGWSPIGNWLVP